MAEKSMGMRIELSLDATELKTGLDDAQKKLRASQKELQNVNKNMKFDTSPINAYKNKIEQINKVLPQMNGLIQKQTNFIRQLEKDRSATSDPKEVQKYNKEIEKQTAYLETLQSQYGSLQKELDYTNNKVQKLTKTQQEAQEKAKAENIEKIGSALNKVSGVVTGLVASITALAVKTSSSIASLNEEANESGVSVESYQKLVYALEELGVKSDTAKQALSKTNNIIAKVASGSGTDVVKVLNQLGVSWSEFEGMDTETAFNTLIDALGQTGDKSKLLTQLTTLFGDSLATKLLPVVEAGSSALQEYGEQATVVSQEQADSATKIEAMKEQLKSSALVISASLLPVLQSLIEKVQSVVDKVGPKIASAIEKFNSLSSPVKAMIALAVSLVSALGPVFTIGTKIWKLCSAQLPKALTALSAHPIIALIAVIATLLATLYSTNEKFRESLNKLVESVLTPLGEIMSTIMDLIQPLIDMLNEMLSDCLSGFGDVLATICDVLADVLKPVLESISDIIKKASSILQPVINFIAKIIEKLNEASSAIRDSLMGVLQNLGSWISDKFTKIAELFIGLWDKMKDAIFAVVDAVRNFFSKVGDWFKTFWNGVTDTWERLGNWFTGDGWNTNDELASLADSASTMGNSYSSNSTSNSSNTTNNNYSVTINTSSDHVSLDELNTELGYSY